MALLIYPCEKDVHDLKAYFIPVKVGENYHYFPAEKTHLIKGHVYMGESFQEYS